MKQQPEYQKMFVKSTNCGKIETARIDAFNIFSNLTKSTLVEAQMAKSNSIPSVTFLPTPKQSSVSPNQTFFRLTTLGYLGKSEWLCKCLCGNYTTVSSSRLKRGITKSCGCYRAIVNASIFKHNQSNTPTYRVWADMKTRCLNPNNHAYKDYGGRGITICSGWKDSFENFLTDMGVRPSKNHCIDRKNNDGNYEPSNCHWVTQQVNQNNKRSNKHFTYNKKKQTYAEWCRELGVNYQTFSTRINRDGKSIVEALGITK